MKKGLRIFLFLLLVLGWIFVIYLLSEMTAKASGGASFRILKKFISETLNVSYEYNLINYVPNAETIDHVAQFTHIMFRKFAHMAAYFVLALIIFHFTTIVFEHNHYIVSFILTIVLCIGLAIFDEYHQLFVDGRSGQMRDVIIDSLGALLGIIRYSIDYIFYEQGYKKGKERQEN